MPEVRLIGLGNWRLLGSHMARVGLGSRVFVATHGMTRVGHYHGQVGQRNAERKRGLHVGIFTAWVNCYVFGAIAAFLAKSGVDRLSWQPPFTDHSLTSPNLL